MLMLIDSCGKTRGGRIAVGGGLFAGGPFAEGLIAGGLFASGLNAAPRKMSRTLAWYSL